MRISVERYVEQVLDGIRYRGHIKIGETQFDYELKFAVPIPEIDGLAPTQDKAEIRRRFQLMLKRDNKDIELADEEYGLFFNLLVVFAAEFYNLPQTRDSNQGFLGMTLRGEGPMADFGASASIGMTRTDAYDFSPKICEMLSASKFGCVFTEQEE